MGQGQVDDRSVVEFNAEAGQFSALLVGKPDGTVRPTLDPVPVSGRGRNALVHAQPGGGVPLTVFGEHLPAIAGLGAVRHRTPFDRRVRPTPPKHSIFRGKGSLVHGRLLSVPVASPAPT